MSPGFNRSDKLSSFANDANEPHGNNNLNKETVLSEKGERINARGDKPNMHDILTGSQPDGRAVAGEEDKTCRNWTSSDEGAAMLGHHDRQGLRDDDSSRSWYSSHPSRGEGGDTAKKPCAAPVATVCFTASPSTSRFGKLEGQNNSGILLKNPLSMKCRNREKIINQAPIVRYRASMSEIIFPCFLE